MISPDSLFVILLLLTLLLTYLDYRVYARRLLTVLVIVIVFLSIFPIGGWLLYPLESRFKHNPDLPKQVAGIIVLGGSVMAEKSLAWQQLEVNGYGERLHSFAELAHKYPDARLIFTGGDSNLDQSKLTEAKIISLHISSLGIEADRLELEDKARNTAENAYYTMRLADPVENSNWILITTAFHMPRAIGVFCNNNWSVIPYPVDHQTNPDKHLDFDLLGHANDLQQAVHEWIGLIAYYLTGKISYLLPNTCK